MRAARRSAGNQIDRVSCYTVRDFDLAGLEQPSERIYEPHASSDAPTRASHRELCDFDNRFREIRLIRPPRVLFPSLVGLCARSYRVW